MINATGGVADLAVHVYDVVVVGGGPAGAAAARALALRGRDVVLLEATAYDGARFGETLPPEIVPVLTELGRWDAFRASSAIESPGTISAWGGETPQETDFIANPYGCGWHVERNAFDAMLSDAARDAGVTVHAATRATRCVRERRSGMRSADDGSPWRVETSGAQAGATRAHFVVDATGRNGMRLGVGDARAVDDVLVAIFLRLAGGPPPESRDLRTLVEAAPDGWWYCAPLPSGESVAAFFTDPARYASEGIGLAEELASAPFTNERLAGARIEASHVVHVPSSMRERAAGSCWAAAGDAAAAYDPLSGFGITKALRGALDLAAAVDRALDGDTGALAEYANGVRSQFEAYAVQRRGYYARETRWAEHPFWRRRHARG